MCFQLILARLEECSDSGSSFSLNHFFSSMLQTTLHLHTQTFNIFCFIIDAEMAKNPIKMAMHDML